MSSFAVVLLIVLVVFLVLGGVGYSNRASWGGMYNVLAIIVAVLVVLLLLDLLHVIAL